jgi:hypothetical protein
MFLHLKVNQEHEEIYGPSKMIAEWFFMTAFTIERFVKLLW